MWQKNEWMEPTGVPSNDGRQKQLQKHYALNNRDTADSAMTNPGFDYHTQHAPFGITRLKNVLVFNQTKKCERWCLSFGRTGWWLRSMQQQLHVRPHIQHGGRWSWPTGGLVALGRCVRANSNWNRTNPTSWRTTDKQPFDRVEQMMADDKHTFCFDFNILR